MTIKPRSWLFIRGGSLVLLAVALSACATPKPYVVPDSVLRSQVILADMTDAQIKSCTYATYAAAAFANLEVVDPVLAPYFRKVSSPYAQHRGHLAMARGGQTAFEAYLEEDYGGDTPFEGLTSQADRYAVTVREVTRCQPYTDQLSDAPPVPIVWPSWEEAAARIEAFYVKNPRRRPKGNRTSLSIGPGVK